MYTESLTKSYLEAYLDSPKVEFVASSRTTDYDMQRQKDIILVASHNTVSAYLVGEGNEPVGQCCYMERNSYIEIGGAKVNEIYRHRGIGKSLVDMVNEIAKVKDSLFMTVDSVRGARDFWGKQGFCEAGVQTCPSGSLTTMDRDIYETSQVNNFECNKNYDMSQKRNVEKTQKTTPMVQ